MVACLRSRKIRLIKSTSFSSKSKNPALNSEMFLAEGWQGLMDFLRSSRHRSNGARGGLSLKVTVKCTGLIHGKVTIPTRKPPAAPETPTRSSLAKYGVCTLHIPARPPPACHLRGTGQHAVLPSARSRPWGHSSPDGPAMPPWAPRGSTETEPSARGPPYLLVKKGTVPAPELRIWHS